MKIQTAFFLSAMLLAASSCTVQKQLYSKGFHIEFHKRQHATNSSNENLIQPVTETPEIEQLTINSDSMTDVSIRHEKEAEVASARKNEGAFRVIKSIPAKLKQKIAAGSNQIRTGISIQTHFSESLMSKSLKKGTKKRSEKKSRDFDWEEFGEWMLILAGTVAFIFLVASMPGVSFTEALIGGLVVILIIILLALLISSAVGDFEWFWSGR